MARDDVRILVTSASGVNGNGYGAVLGFGPEGDFAGPFSSDPRVADPRGLSLDPSGALVYLNSGEDRVLALDLDGYVVRDSGRIPGLDPGGAEFGPDGRYYLTARRQRTIRVMPASLDADGDNLLPSSRFRAGSASGPTSGFTSPQASGRPEKAITPSWSSIALARCSRLGW
jgi:DNA-binding beta-propeller fold protein YncE